MSFTPIETQEALDKIISERLSRESEKHNKALQALMEERDSFKKSGEDLQTLVNQLNEQKKTDDAMIAKQKSAIDKYVAATERAEVAREFGLPRELEDRLKGEDKDAMREDAEYLKKVFHANNVAPLARQEVNKDGDTKREASRKMLKELKGEE